MAAGTSSRFVPLSIEKPKGLLSVKGDVLIERQICQLKEAGVDDITIITGFKADLFSYLKDKFGVSFIYNNDYSRYNNTSSIVRVLDRLSNTYICCSDHYFSKNVFLDNAEESYYAALYAKGKTDEYCLVTDSDDYIKEVNVGGADCWFMAGHVYITDSFSKSFCGIMEEEYRNNSVRNSYWEDVYIKHIQDLPLKIKRFANSEIIEFDTLDELRTFDESYISDTRSSIVKEICKRLSCQESEIYHFNKMSFKKDKVVFTFEYNEGTYYLDWTPYRIRISKR